MQRGGTLAVPNSCWSVLLKLLPGEIFLNKGRVVVFCTRCEHTDKDEEQGTLFSRSHVFLGAGLEVGLNEDLQN